MISRKQLTRWDGLLLILLFIAGFWLTAISVNKPVHPAEDAAMLMRYSQHLAQGYGIVWNIGQPPVDGATDFLFMVVLAGFYALGNGLESTVLWVCGIAHILTTMIVYFGMRRYFKGGILSAVLTVVFLLLGSGLRYTEACFGTPFFAFFCALSWLLAQMVVEQPRSIGRAAAFSLSCLLMGLTRPEGVLVAGFMLAAILFRLGWKPSKRIILIFCSMFLFLGGVYFLWRWNYFGYPLPNPFYKKGGGRLYPDSLSEAVKGVLEMSFPFWLIYAAGILGMIWAGWNKFVLQANWFGVLSESIKRFFIPEKRRILVSVTRTIGMILLLACLIGLFRQSSSLHAQLIFGRYSASYAGLLTALLVTGMLALFVERWLPVNNPHTIKTDTMNPLAMEWKNGIRSTIYVLIPVVGFTLMWVLLSNEMNYLWRFQYPILPVILMSWPLIAIDLWAGLSLPEPETWSPSIRGLVILAGLVLGIGLAFSQTDRWQITYQSDGRYEVAQYLSQYADKHYTLASTEAGLLPLYSGWQAVDTWGLNDAWIAHNGGITMDYLARVNPEVIMFHADFSPVNPQKEPADAWGSMLNILDTYARDHQYILAAAYGDNPVDTHYYYVRPDFPESRDIVTFIQSLDGGAYHYGAHTLDYNKLTWKKDTDAK